MTAAEELAVSFPVVSKGNPTRIQPLMMSATMSTRKRWLPTISLRVVYDRTETDLKARRQHVASIEQQIAELIQQRGATRVNLATSVIGSHAVTNR